MDSARTLIDADQQYLIHPLHYAKDNEEPLVIVKATGELLIDADGKQYIDGLSCLWNVNIGHGRKELADAAAAQMTVLDFASVYSGATNPAAVRLAEKLVKLAYSNTSAVYFTTAGAESNESAFKMARFFWKVRGKPEKVKIFSRIHAYHGLTMAAMSATGMASYHKMFGPLVPNFLQVVAPYPIAGPATAIPASALPKRSRRRFLRRALTRSLRSSPSR
jgi:putrescine aminotransferase